MHSLCVTDTALCWIVKVMLRIGVSVRRYPIDAVHTTAKFRDRRRDENRPMFTKTLFLTHIRLGGSPEREWFFKPVVSCNIEISWVQARSSNSHQGFDTARSYEFTAPSCVCVDGCDESHQQDPA